MGPPSDALVFDPNANPIFFYGVIVGSAALDFDIVMISYLIDLLLALFWLWSQS